MPAGWAAASSYLYSVRSQAGKDEALRLSGGSRLAKQFGQSQAATFTGKYAVAAQPTSLLADLIGEGMAGVFKQVPIYQVCQRQ